MSMSISSSRAVSMSTGGGSARSAWIRRHTSNPSMPGSMTSSTTRSGRSWFAEATAVAVNGDVGDPAFRLETASDLVRDVRFVLNYEHNGRVVISCHVFTVAQTSRQAGEAGCNESGGAARVLATMSGHSGQVEEVA